MRFITAVALALVMLWVPVDGVAQTSGSNELSNLLYEARSCMRGNPRLNAIDPSALDERSRERLLEMQNEVNCTYVLDPYLEFEARNVGPAGRLNINRVSSENPYEVSIGAGTGRCLLISQLLALSLVYVSMVTGEIYPYDDESGSAPDVCYD